MIAALLAAAAHLYLFSWPGQPPKALFLLPSAGESPCAVETITFGAPDGSWSSGSAGPKASCEFRQWAEPGTLFPFWVDAGKITSGSDIEVSWTFAGGHATGKGHAATVKAEPIGANDLKTASGGLSGTIAKVKNDSKVELKNAGPGAVLVGDAVAARTKPEDKCLGGGPQILLQPGETMVDIRPGPVSKSMVIWAALFTGPTQCRWVEVRPR